MNHFGYTDPTCTRKHRGAEAIKSNNRYARSRVMYPWKSSEIGRVGLVLIYMYAKQYASDDQMYLKNSKELGIKFDHMLVWIRDRFPQLFTDHINVVGTSLDADKLQSRYANMFRDNRTKNFALGPEHPKNHKELKPVLDQVEAAFRQSGFAVDTLHDWFPELPF